MNVFLVRHANAGDSESWKGDDRSRPLNARGHAQARGLVRQLEGERVQLVGSSPYLRCLQTVAPLAAARQLEVGPVRLLAEGSDWHETLSLLCGLPGPGVMCSQGDVIGGIVTQLLESRLVEPDAVRWQKGSAWVLDVDGGSVRSASYLPPLEV